MPYVGRSTDKISNVEVLDNITFDGSSSYTLQKNSVNFTPSSANTLLLSIDGVVQAGNFTVSGSTIDFGTAVAGTSTCDFVLHYGVGLITAPSDGTVTEAKIGTGAVTEAKIGTGAVTSAKLASGTVQNQSAFKNIIINGDMSIAQRGTSATGLGDGDSGYHTVDRWKFNESGTPTYEFTMTQDTDVPSGQGFAKSMKLACTTAQTSLGTDNNLRFMTILEGQNLQYLKFGTSNAESLTLSFWVKSNKTGDYSVALYNGDTVDIITRTITINSANTWEKKTLTFSGDTGNNFSNDNGASLYLWINLLTGTDYNTSSAVNWTSYSSGRLAYGQTVNLADSTSNYINITGVQLEAGTSASDFEFLPFDINQRRCQRYYYRVNPTNLSAAPIGTAIYYSSSAVFTQVPFPITMRAAPTLEQVTGTNYFNVNRNADNDFFDAFELSNAGTESTTLYVSSGLSATSGDAGRTRFANTSARLAFVSEL